jgi:serine protease
MGIAGVDWNCRLLPVRVLGIDGGKGADSDIADGILWAAGVQVVGSPPNGTPAAVINMSFGGPGLSSLLQAAVDAARTKGAIVIASAGNDGVDAATYAPAGLKGVIAIGAVDPKGMLASYSNRGPRVDLVAPGGDLAMGPTWGILSTMRPTLTDYSYVYYTGTSQAAPHVSGVAALMKAVDPNLSADDAHKIFQATADASYRCMEGCGAGLLQADTAVAAATFASGCVLGCGDGQLCIANQCVSIASGPVDVVGGYGYTHRGCSVAGVATGERPGAPATLAAALLLASLVVRRRRCRRV